MAVEDARVGESLQDDRILIVGGGMAGSLLAVVLGRAGQAVSLIDPYREPPQEFRNEKLGIDQIAALDDLGVLSCFEEACWGPDGAAAEMRPPMKDCGARYDRWIARLRAALPSEVSFVEGKVDRIETGPDRQSVLLAGGTRIAGRLVVLATGRGDRLRTGLGVTRRVFSKRHSLCLGFSIASPAHDPWDVRADIWHGRFGDKIAYATFFPMLDEVRVNVFCHHDLDDPWVVRMRADPAETLSRTLPEAAGPLAGARIVRPLEIRSTDLYAVEGHVQAGLVLVGDAFHAPCPSSGTGMSRILNDVGLLARTHIPAWLASPGMGPDKVAAFYADPAKLKVDAESVRRSLSVRDAAVSQSLRWKLRRSLTAARRTLMPDRTKAAHRPLEPSPARA